MYSEKNDLIKEMKRYAEAESELKKIEHSIELKIQKVKEQYHDKIKKWLHIQATASEHLQTAAFYYYNELFSEIKSIDLKYGTIGFRKGKHKVVKQGNISWDEICTLCEKKMPAFLRLKKEVDKVKILATKNEEKCMEQLKQIGISVIQDEYFFLRTYEA